MRAKQRTNRLGDFFRLDPSIVANGTFIDAGAARGVFSERAMNYPYRKVIAFEPNPSFYGKLFNDFYDVPRFEVHNKALSSAPGYADMKICKTSKGGELSTLSLDPRKPYKLVRTELVTIDSYGIDDLHFLKIDVEGHELEVLKGAEQTLLNNSPMIKLEMSKNHQETFDYLSELGYRVVGHVMRRDVIPLDGEVKVVENGWKCDGYTYCRERYDREWSRPEFEDWPRDLNPFWGDFIFTKEK